jgi:peptidyl-prolyl isomerase F (cyclophilin D)
MEPGQIDLRRKFADENFTLRHTGPDPTWPMQSNTRSQFFLCTIETSWLDGKHVVFGSVVEGMEVVKKMESYGAQSGSPRAKILIADCGQL